MRSRAGWCSRARPPITAGIANARLTYMVQRQSRYSVRKPPSSRPTAAPAAGDRAVNAERLAALGGVGERGRSAATAPRGRAGRRTRPEARGRRRRRRSCRRAPPIAEAPAKPSRPTTNVRLRPKRSPIRPPSSSRLPKASAYAVIDPLTAVVGEAEVGLGRRQRDVHDRRVEDDHQLGEAEHREDQPAAGVVGVGLGAHRVLLKWRLHLNLGGTVAHKWRSFLRLATIRV